MNLNDIALETWLVLAAIGLVAIITEGLAGNL